MRRSIQIILLALLAETGISGAVEKPLTAMAFRHLEKAAATPADFRRLADWCERKVAEARAKEALCEAELREYKARPGTSPLPKYPPRDETLKTLIVNYKNAAGRWAVKAERYRQQANNR